MLNMDIYAGAVIRLATLQRQRGQAGCLLFGTVSLLPRGRPLPPPMEGGAHRCAVGKAGENVFFRRVLLTVQDAVDWYRSLGRGENTTRQALWVTDLSWLGKPLRQHWPKLAGVGMIELHREISGKISSEQAFYIAARA